MKVTSILLALVLIGQTACSISMALNQPPPVDLTGIGLGSSRTDVINKVGFPKSSDLQEDGTRTDAYEFASGLPGAAKTRVILYMAADFFTFTLAELILWPLEATLLKEATCHAVGEYNKANRLQAWAVTKTNGEQHCN